MLPMAETSTTHSQSSEAIDYPPGRRPYEYKPILAPFRPAPSVAFGFILNLECRLRWTRWFKELLYGPENLEGKSPEEVREYLSRMERTIRRVLPSLIYTEFPSLRPLRNTILPIVEADPSIQRYIFVLRDNATWEGLKAPLTAEVIEGVRQRLGVGDVDPNWYHIMPYVPCPSLSSLLLEPSCRIQWYEMMELSCGKLSLCRVHVVSMQVRWTWVVVQFHFRNCMLRYPRDGMRLCAAGRVMGCITTSWIVQAGL
ncbi:hypothetical protein C8Q74DRAFT_1308245 [Fomes fomentarius]|nr:hypothetical protein C8Q74DRAFT_1308245 [Fomes fomentarius]